MIRSGKIKALFLDEWEIETEFIADISGRLQFLWIVPNATHQMNKKQNELQEDFESLHLTFNMRNAVDIVEESKLVMKTKPFRHKEGLAPTPPNFPRGFPPVQVKTLDDAIDHARKLTSDGILIIANTSFDVPFWLLRDQKADFYGTLINVDDSVDSIQDPIQALKNGRILVTTQAFISGFEWPTVIHLSLSKNANIADVEDHECNIFLRCTNQLIISD